MNFTEASEWATEGETVQRETWARHRYAWVADGGWQQTTYDELSDTTARPTPYTPTDEDRAATDWIAYVG